jgi:hypothetical protein
VILVIDGWLMLWYMLTPSGPQVCIYICIYILWCMYKCIHVNVFTYEYVYMCIHDINEWLMLWYMLTPSGLQVCIYVYICIYILWCMYKCIHVNVFKYEYVYMCIHDSGHQWVANAVVHVDPLGSTGMYICIYIHVYIYMYTFICIHIHVYVFKYEYEYMYVIWWCGTCWSSWLYKWNSPSPYPLTLIHTLYSISPNL